MPELKISRRKFLKLSAGGAILLSPLMRIVRAEAETALPKRAIFNYNGIGTNYPSYLPTGTETSFTLGSILSPLNPYKSDVIVMGGIERGITGPEEHAIQIGSWLNNMPMQFVPGTNTPTLGSGPSIDQFLAQKIGGATKFRSIVLGTRMTDPSDGQTTVSYAGKDQPVRPMDDPVKAFDNLFSGITGGTTLDVVRQNEKSILDYVLTDLNALYGQVTGIEKSKLDAHMQAIRDLEQGLLASQTACTPPLRPTSIDPYNEGNYTKLMKLHMDLLIAAIGCDLTRIVTLQWGSSNLGLTFSWVSGINEWFHGLSHLNKGDTESKRQLDLIFNWYSQQLVYLIQKMKAIPEGNGNMFDNSVIYSGNGMGNGWSHTRYDIPCVLAGSCGGYFKTGRFLNYSPREDCSRMLVSIANAMGVPITTFGDPNTCKGPMPRLTG